MYNWSNVALAYDNALWGSEKKTNSEWNISTKNLVRYLANTLTFRYRRLCFSGEKSGNCQQSVEAS